MATVVVASTAHIKQCLEFFFVVIKLFDEIRPLRFSSTCITRHHQQHHHTPLEQNQCLIVTTTITTTTTFSKSSSCNTGSPLEARDSRASSL